MVTGTHDGGELGCHAEVSSRAGGPGATTKCARSSHHPRPHLGGASGQRTEPSDVRDVDEDVSAPEKEPGPRRAHSDQRSRAGASDRRPGAPSPRPPTLRAGMVAVPTPGPGGGPPPRTATARQSRGPAAPAPGCPRSPAQRPGHEHATGRMSADLPARAAATGTAQRAQGQTLCPGPGSRPVATSAPQTPGPRQPFPALTALPPALARFPHRRE